jgi:hypothetical protein
MQCLRIWNTAISVTHSFISKSGRKTSERNPFAMEEVALALPSLTPDQDTSRSDDDMQKVSQSLPDGWQWTLASGLYEIQYTLAEYHFLKGSFRDTEYFVTQARQSAESIHAIERIAQADVLLADIQLHRGRREESDKTLILVETRMTEFEVSRSQSRSFAPHVL